VFIVVLSACQSRSEQEWILYSGRIENADGTSVLDIETGGTERVAQWSPDGTQIGMLVDVENRGSIWVAKADGSEPRQVSDEFNFTWVTWLNDDLLLTTAFTKGESIEQDVYTNYILNLKDGSMQVYSEILEPVIPLPSGDRWLGWGFYSHQVHLYNLDGETQTLFTEFNLDHNRIAVSPSSQEIVLCNQDYSKNPARQNGLHKTSLGPNMVSEPEFVYQTDGCTPVRWSPNGQYVALLDNQNRIHVLDETTFSLVNVLDVGRLQTNTLIWSPDSKFIAVNKHYDEPEVRWEDVAKVNIETGEIIRLTKSGQLEQILDWRILSLE
jgi:dipeptidyl aminopeptidase/acylaminoacyl peptidase